MKQNNQMIIGAAIALCATMVHGADLAGTAPFQFRYDASLSGLPEEVASKAYPELMVDLLSTIRPGKCSSA